MPKGTKQIIDKSESDIERLERIRSVIYQFLVPGKARDSNITKSDQFNSEMELKPKTYTEAVKCYLDVDSRIDEKQGKTSNLGFRSWEEIIRRCMHADTKDFDDTD